ncbi:dTDP-4-dehydrorhamnose reductase [soil metagenome]
MVRRLDRFSHPPANRRPKGPLASVSSVDMQGCASRALLITGATGTLGQAFARICEKRGVAYHLLSRAEMNITDPDSVSAAFDRYSPWAVVNTAGFARVDDAEREVEQCMRDNVVGPANLARACVVRKIPFVTFSSDLVFDGGKGKPYLESDVLSPVNIYGQSKAEAEREVLEAHPDALVIRSSAFFGPWDEANFATSVLSAVVRGRTFRAADDLTVSPTYVPDLVNTILDIIIDGERGIWHLANAGAMTWAQLARRVAEGAGYDPGSIVSCTNASLGLAASRPHFSALSSERASLMRPFEEALRAYFEERQFSRRSLAATV